MACSRINVFLAICVQLATQLTTAFLLTPSRHPAVRFQAQTLVQYVKEDDSIPTRVAVLENNEKHASKSLDRIEKLIIALGTDVKQLGTEVKQLGTEVKQLDTKIEKMGTEVKQLDTKIENIDTKFEKKFEKMDTKFEKMDTKIDKVDAKLGTLIAFVAVLTAVFGMMNASSFLALFK